jgi:hypothetical protein
VRHPKPLPKLHIQRHHPQRPGMGASRVVVGRPEMTVGWIGVILLGVIGVLAVTHTATHKDQK